MILDISDIKKLIPHRKPFLFIEECNIINKGTKGESFRTFKNDEYFFEGQRLQEAINQAYDKKLLGKNACGSGWDFDIHIHYGAGAYICG